MNHSYRTFTGDRAAAHAWRFTLVTLPLLLPSIAQAQATTRIAHADDLLAIAEARDALRIDEASEPRVIAEAPDPPARIYVRRIEFEGVARVADQVLRRELLQLEGAYLNTVALEQSRLALERLPYVERARVAVRPVAGTPDVVDVVIEIAEAPARRYGAGGAYSESLRTSLNGYFINENLFGTGQRFSASIEGSELRSITELSHTEPYARPEGVSRTLGLAVREIDRLTVDTSAIDLNFASARLEYGYRLGRGAAPAGAIEMGVDLRDTELSAAASLASAQLADWIAHNGDASTSPAVALSTAFTEAAYVLRWRYDTRARRSLFDDLVTPDLTDVLPRRYVTVFPDRGLEQTLSFRATLPGSDVEYYAIDYDVAKHWPLGNRWTATLRGRLGFGTAYGDETSSLPPHLNWFAGGPATVRGYRENGLGPRDSLGNPHGGNLLLASQLEIMTPWPERWRERTRVGFFYDVGNVFSTEDVAFADESQRPLDYGFGWSDLRQSVGLAVHVLIPLGVLRVSYAVPLDAEERGNSPFRDDDIDRFQLSIGVDFL